MKKLLIGLMISVACFGFMGCLENEDLLGILAGETVGRLDLTIDGSTHSFTGTGFYTAGGKTYIAATKGSESVLIVLDGTSSRTYTLGFMNTLNIEEILRGGFGGFGSMSSTLVYIPVGTNREEGFAVLAGTCTISEASSSYIVGTFRGSAIRKSDLSNISSAILSGQKQISGSFKAFNSSNIANLF